MTATASTPVALGRFVWLELMTPDTDAATKFYTKVVGWTTTPFDGEIPYTMWTSPAGPIGGLMALTPDMKARGVPPHWMAYVSVPDCDATLKQVTQLGGQVKMPGTDIPNVGRFGVFADPQGAVIAILTPHGENSNPNKTPGVGEVVWHELATTDHEAALKFYQTIFGWEKTSSMEMGPGNLYQMYGRAGESYGGMYNIDPSKPQPTAWLHYVEVADVEK